MNTVDARIQRVAWQGLGPLLLLWVFIVQAGVLAIMWGVSLFVDMDAEFHLPNYLIAMGVFSFFVSVWWSASLAACFGFHTRLLAKQKGREKALTYLWGSPVMAELSWFKRLILAISGIKRIEDL